MATTYLSRFLGLMNDAENEMDVLFSRLAANVAREVRRNADADGNIPISATLDIQEAAGRLVTGTFLGRDQDGNRAPFIVRQNGDVFPLSPFMRVLWRSIRQGVRQGVERHATIMERRLPPDILAVLRSATRNPFVEAERLVSEQELFKPNPLAQYDAPHLWVDPNGYTLSERVWQTAGRTRRQLDSFLQESIAAGRGALDIADDLEVFLQPGRQLVRTNTPYGLDASFDAMRLARTEITRAAAQANEMSAEMNPFVEGLRVVLSRSHPKPDICDEAAAAGPWPKGEIPDRYRIPLHPHCLCHYQYEMIGNAQEVLDDLRDDIRAARSALADKIGPVQTEQFTQQLLRGSFQFQEVQVF